jgi:biopolymer transport protein ExbB/TolQ
MNKSNSLFQAVTRSPFFWGILGAAGFYGVLAAFPPDLPQLELVRRYLTHHPVEYMETTLFAIGLAVLVGKALEVFAQRSTARLSLLGPMPLTPQTSAECGDLLALLEESPQNRRDHFYVARLRAALEHVRWHASAETLDDELKYLADRDADRAHAGFGLFRVIVWAIPILGFLGTVIGITMALMSMNAQDLAGSMTQVICGLGLKFDTTALALTFSIVLMFLQFPIERAESSMLDEVDRNTFLEMSGRFAIVPGSAGSEGQFFAVRRMTEALMQATEALVRRQAELWQASVDAAAKNWTSMSDAAAENVRLAMNASNEQMQKTLLTAAEHFGKTLDQSGDQTQKTLAATAGDMHRAMTSAAGDLNRQTETLQRAIEAAGEVARLEDALNRNLSALAGSKHFEQTVLSLAAAVNMLSAQVTDTGTQVRLDARRSVHAA